MRMLEDANLIDVSVEALHWALSLPVPSDARVCDGRFLDILEYVRDRGAPDPASIALAIGWRLQALEAFLASRGGESWSSFDRRAPGSLHSPIVLSATVEPLVERDRRPRFNHATFAGRLRALMQ